MSRIRNAFTTGAVLALILAGAIAGPAEGETGTPVNQVTLSCDGLTVHLAGYDAGNLVLTTDGIHRENGAFGAGYDFYYPWYREFDPDHTWRLQTWDPDEHSPIYDSGTVHFTACPEVDEIAAPTFTEGDCVNPPTVTYPAVTGVEWETSGEVDFGHGVRVTATPADGYTLKPDIQTIWDHTFRPQGVCRAPGPPTDVAAVAGNGRASVTWSAPTDGGSAPVTGYTVTSDPDAVTCTASAPATDCTVSGLTNGTAYSFTVTTTNAVGISVASQPSTAVVPAAPPVAPADAPGKVRSLRVSGTAHAQHRVVRWRPPAHDGGAPVARYSVTVKQGHHQLLRRVVQASHHKLKLSIKTRWHGRDTVIVRAGNPVGYGKKAHTAFTVR